MSTSSPVTNLRRAEYEGDPPPPDACAYCQRPLPGEYFRVGGHLACIACANQAQSLVPPDSHKAFSRAILFGILAAVAGCMGYALFGIMTGITLGWAAIGVGYLIGWSMKKGSRGLGGRRYQIAAVLLTYAAVAVAFVPMALHDRNEEKRDTGSVQSPAQQNAANDARAANSDAARDTGKTPAEARTSFSAFLLAILMLLGIGLISPFLLFTASVASGAINLFILFLGMRTAWQLATSPRVNIEGPFSQS